MQRRTLTKPSVIVLLLIVQLVPLVLFPAASFSPGSQEWWLPVLLAIMVIAADVELIVRRSTASWPWLLIGFAQGFNIISRLMMVWPHATRITESGTVVDWSYITLSVIAMVLSALLLWYTELPQVRMGLLRPD